MFNWGFLNLSLGEVTLDIKKVWREGVAILCVLAWAAFGNAVYDKWNWFFIKESIFPFLSDEIMPLMVVLGVFGVCLVVYGIYYLARYIAKVIPLGKKSDESPLAQEE